MRWRYLFAVLASTSASLLAPSSTPRCSNGIYMKQATASKKGFAMKPKAVKIKKRAVVPLDPSVKAALDELETLGPASLRTHLNPALFEDPQTMADIGKRLQNGEVVILRDAFRPEFAEMVYQELAAKDVPWSLNEAYFNDGYHHHHHNVYDKGLWSQRLNSTFDVFRHQDSMSLMAELSGRDCSGETTGAPSWYQSGDHSLPHTDWVGQRTVSYVWHLSKDWKPEWGGALYWAQHHHSVATHPASFNTLCLFSVTTTSAHFVTTVSPKHKGKRLTFNGWWQTSWLPSLDDDLEGWLESKEGRASITHSQMQMVTDMLNDPWQNIPEERKEKLSKLRLEVFDELFPDGVRAGIEA